MSMTCHSRRSLSPLRTPSTAPDRIVDWGHKAPTGAKGDAVKQFDVPALVEADPTANATDLLVVRVKETPNTVLFALPTSDGGWSDVTAAEFLAQVTALAKGFVAAGIEPGDKIGIMCKTSYEWTLIDFAVWFAGAVLVPIYEQPSARRPCHRA